ncbi:MAG: DUF2066 domain-containing protein [Pseudomonadota bacterium]
MNIGKLDRRRLVVAALSVVWLGSLGLAGPEAFAVEVGGLYTAQVELRRGESNPQRAAYADALKVILVRITGREGAADDEDLIALFPTPQQYVQRFRRGPDDTQIVTLDGTAIENILRGAGYPVWGIDRPLTLVWLAVDRGPDGRSVIAADDPDFALPDMPTADADRALRERILEAAERRGLPVLFPLMDAEDREAITFSDIWGGFDDVLLRASRRYGASSILVGRIRDEGFLDNRFTYFFGNEQITWTAGAGTAIDLMADELASQFAYAGNAPVESVALNVSGVDSVAAYGAVQRLLKGLTVIERFQIETVAGSEVRYLIDVQGGEERLASALQFSGVLTRTDLLGASEYFADDARRNELDFAYRPLTFEQTGLDGNIDADRPDELPPPLPDSN